ncbi:MAG TPA: hypothetical protein VMU89_16470 [Thermomicrobiaceae bacterium]|nr:hypothetical protein [Thermomicrobiaceae bacterium]
MRALRHRMRLLLAVAFALVPLLLSVPAVSASGTSILVYIGDGGLNQGYTDFGNAVGLPVDTLSTLPADLSPYDCIVLPVNGSMNGATAFSAGDRTALTSYTQGGGHVIAVGEWYPGPGGLSDYAAADATMNDMATALGATMTLESENLDGPFAWTDQIDPSPLTAGVDSIAYGATDSVAVSGTAVSLVRTALDGDQPGTTFIAAQAIQAGTFVLVGDSNVFSDYASDGYTEHDNGVLARNVCLRSLGLDVVPLYDTTRAKNAPATVPVKIQANDDAGANVSGASLVVHAVSLTMGTATISPVPAPGHSQPDGNFTFDPALGSGGGYQFNVKTTGLAPGTWTLNVMIGTDPTLHGTTFVVR